MTKGGESEFDGMTTNERLFVSGLLSEYDNAVARRDLNAVRRLLESVHVDEPSIQLILKKLMVG